MNARTAPASLSAASASVFDWVRFRADHAPDVQHRVPLAQIARLHGVDPVLIVGPVPQIAPAHPFREAHLAEAARIGDLQALTFAQQGVAGLSLARLMHGLFDACSGAFPADFDLLGWAQPFLRAAPCVFVSDLHGWQDDTLVQAAARSAVLRGRPVLIEGDCQRPLAPRFPRRGLS